MTDEERAQKMKAMGSGMFSRAAATYDQVGPRFFATLGRRLVELADIPMGASVLDVATGRGAVLFPASERVGAQGRVIGIDLAEGMVAETNAEIRERGITNAEARVMDAEALDFPDESFDVVCCGFIIFFLPHLADSLAGFRRVLKPGGLLAVSTWGRADERWKWMSEVFDAYLPPDAPKPPSGPSRFNNAAGIETVMREGGFEQIKVIDEDHDFVYADEEMWWAVQWSHGRRWLLEMMPPDALAKLKDEAFEKIQVNREADGFHHLLPTLFTLARKAL